MKNCLKIFLFLHLNLLVSNLFAQEKAALSVDCMPNANIFVIKIKNSHDLKNRLNEPPFDSLLNRINFPIRYNNIANKLKKWIDNENPNELKAEILNELKKWIENEPVDSVEEKIKEFEKNQINETNEPDHLQNVSQFYKNKGENNILECLTGEIMITGSLDSQVDNLTQLKESINLTIVAQAHLATFQNGIDHLFRIEKELKSTPIISIKEHENVKYYAIEKFKNTSVCFVACMNDIAVISNKEDLLKKTLTSIAKKGVYENGLKSNEKFVNYLNKNTSKDLVIAFDAAIIFKNLLKKQKGVCKLFLEAMKFDELLEGYGFLEISDAAITLEFSLKGLDDGFLQFATFVNREFTPSNFIKSDVISYSKLFFSISEFKSRIFAIGSKVNPELILQAQSILDSAKTKYQFDLDSFLTSFRVDIETFKTIGSCDSVITYKLKNTEDFSANLKKTLEATEIYNTLKYSFLTLENKEKDFACWQILNGQHYIGFAGNFAIGATEDFAFVIRNSSGNFGPQFGKGIAYSPMLKFNNNLPKSSNVISQKLCDNSTYQKARALYPAKIALFCFLQNQGLQDYSNEQPEEMWLKYNWCVGVWKDKNQITISSKLINE